MCEHVCKAPIKMEMLKIYQLFLDQLLDIFDGKIIKESYQIEANID